MNNHGSAVGQQALANTPHRRVLGDVSPNVKAVSATPAFLKKPPASSPLKRSYTASIEGSDGLRYLKKRKLSEEEALSQVDGVSESSLGNDMGPPHAVGAGFHPIFQPTTVHGFQAPMPEIAEPSPTEPNTPSDEGDYSQDSSAERKSFSSLINYDPSSQKSSLAFSSVSKAELLKLRLRVAIYKVQTDQIDVSFTNLRIPQPPQTPKSHTAQVVEAAVAQLRREAQEVNARQLSAVPKLLPAPILRPTAYSSRMIYDTNIPSSPPVSLSPEKLPTAADVLTPRRGVGQYGTPHGSVERLRRPEPELTSSAVKGRVAEGLLGLRNAA